MLDELEMSSLGANLELALKNVYTSVHFLEIHTYALDMHSNWTANCSGFPINTLGVFKRKNLNLYKENENLYNIFLPHR